MTQTALRQRLQLIGRARAYLAAHVDGISASKLVSEILPLLEACRYLERSAERILAPRLCDSDQPSWLRGVDVEVHREPLGRVLIIGPGNYPMMLPGIQVMQAYAAGNTVLLKPGVGGTAAAGLLRDALQGELQVLPEDPQAGIDAIRQGVEKVVLTGSRAAGDAVLRVLAEHGTPSVMELSGDDPVFIRHDADLELVRKALRFGQSLNNGNTCIAPKRIFLARELASQLEEDLRGSYPVQVTTDDDQALAAAESEYALGATVFGEVEGARRLAARVRAGVVVINDMIVPTADPRLPFGGRGASGFGVTRGEEGLLEMTAVKAIAIRRSRWLPHLEREMPADQALFRGFIMGSHGGTLRERLGGWKLAAQAMMQRRAEEKLQ